METPSEAHTQELEPSSDQTSHPENKDSESNSSDNKPTENGLGDSNGCDIDGEVVINDNVREISIGEIMKNAEDLKLEQEKSEAKSEVKSEVKSELPEIKTGKSEQQQKSESDCDSNSESDEANNDNIKVKGNSKRFKVGSAETIGRRCSMEDRTVIYGSLQGNEQEDYFAVFDGHGGVDASNYSSAELHNILKTILTEKSQNHVEKTAEIPEDKEKQTPEDLGKEISENQGKEISEEQGKKISEDQGKKISEDQGKEISEDKGKEIPEEQSKLIQEDQGKEIPEEQSKLIQEDQGKEIPEEQGKQISEEQGKQISEEQGKQISEEQGKQTPEDQQEKKSENDTREKNSENEFFVQCFKEAFSRCNESMKTLNTCNETGTTAVVVYSKGRQLWVANTGDSRAVLSRAGQAVRVTTDHKPSLESEKRRILDLRGFVFFGRVNGVLAVSRALGDFSFNPHVTCEPDVFGPFDVYDPENQFLILACDGLWDVIDDNEAVRMILESNTPEKGANEFAGELVNAAIRARSTDNISVVVIFFPYYAKKCMEEGKMKE